jgi:hypothetical protein
MEPNYYVNTIINSAKTLGPIAIFLIGGYLIFIKMPFLFLKKSMDTQKKKLQEENKGLEIAEQKYSVEDYKEFQRKMKLMNSRTEVPKLKALDTSDSKKEEPRAERRQAPRPETKQAEAKSEQKKEEVKKPAPAAAGQTPEQILGLKPNESFTKEELKKKYFDLLKQNHPDRVASMGEDFKKLAEKNTKEINRAYDKLKNRAA